MTVAKDGPRTGGLVTGRGTPQSGIPTQGGFPGGPGPRPSGPFPMPPPPGWQDARPVHPEAETSLVGTRSSARGGRYALRWTLIGVAAAVEVFVLFSAVMWWLGGAAHTNAVASMAPMTWTGIVYDVGNAGVNLRSESKVDPADSRDTAMRGSRLALSCGQTGDVVHKGNVSTATWLKTTDGLFVSMLYVRVPDRQSIPSCNGSKVDGPLLALADPANPQLPPPPNAHLTGSSGGGGTATANNQTALQPLAGGTEPAPVAAAPPMGSGVAPPGVAAPAPAQTRTLIGEGTSTPRTSAPPATTTAAPAAQHAAVNPDTTPVG